MLVTRIIANTVCSIAALAISCQPALAQYPATGFTGFGQSMAPHQSGGYATSRPQQADPVADTGVSNHRSMSPDSWGNPAGGGASDPFATPAFTNPSEQAYSFQNPMQGYSNTGAPGLQNAQRSPAPGSSNSFPSHSPTVGGTPFRSVDSQIIDHKDLPLAPTVTGSVLDDSATGPETDESSLPLMNGLELNGPDLSGPHNGNSDPMNLDSTPLTSEATNLPNEVLGELNPPPAQLNSSSYGDLLRNNFPDAALLPEDVVPLGAFQSQPNSLSTDQPVGSATPPFPNAPQAFPNVQQPLNTAPPSLNMPPAYQYPQVIPSDPVPTSTSQFGWGAAPGMFAPTYKTPLTQTQYPTANRKPLSLWPNRSHANVNHATTQETPALGVLPPGQFRPDVGHRHPAATVRNGGNYDSGAKEYDFENKKTQYPPFSEILATGRYFGSVEGQFLRAVFSGNSGSVTQTVAGGTTTVNANAFDFDYEMIPRVRFGFESKYGPGFEIDYSQLRTASIVDSFTSSANASASITAAAPRELSSSISTVGVGDLFNAQHFMDVETIGVSVFKEVQLPITRINGLFGFQFANISQQMQASVVDSGSVQQSSLRTQSDIRAFGPRIRLEYFRPVGHTPVEFITTVGGSIMFGRRDQFIDNSGTTFINRAGVDEFVSTFEFMSGIQMRKKIGENRAVFGRFGFTNQVWNSGGNAVIPQADFGLRGYSFMLGYNR